MDAPQYQPGFSASPHRPMHHGMTCGALGNWPLFDMWWGDARDAEDGERGDRAGVALVAVSVFLVTVNDD